MAETPLYRYNSTTEETGTATVTVDPTRRGTPVDERLFAKFAEHLGRNIDGGMHAQVLNNPTFGPWEFPADDDHPDGGIQPAYDHDEIRQSIRNYCRDWDLPNPGELADAYFEGTAFGWVPTDKPIRTTPDTSPEGDRAQRVVLDGSDGGILQRTYFPFHRTDVYELTTRLRTTEPRTVTIGIYAPDANPSNAPPLAKTTVDTNREWATYDDELTVSSDADDEPHIVAITTAGDVDVIIDRLTIYPDDHVDKADPEVIEYLREIDLPLLRWPGGNFVSGYDWRDGVGPVEERPSRVNPAWGHVEPNLFGTAEFIDFCAAVGCEPMICVNAGDGSPEAAAQWVEYCNGDPEETEMGALRAAHGYPEPFDVTHWEIGNELFGRWQVGWTTPSGNADRYQRFREAMLDADPTIEVQACGNRNSPNDAWNQQLLNAAGSDVETITDHILSGGTVDAGTDPDELFHGFMGYADQLGREYRALRDAMCEVGVENPHLAITELQLFAHFTENREIGHHGGRLSPESMPTRLTVSEPLYDATIVHECIRMGKFVQMLTHSATVNHGGGLQKKRERTWADPAHYGHVLLRRLAGGTPLGVEVVCETVSTTTSFGDIETIDALPVIDAMAVEHDDEVVVTLVNRRSEFDPIDLKLDVGDTATSGSAEVTMLAGDTMADENTYENPHQITPSTEQVSMEGGTLSLTLPPYTLVRVIV